MWDGGAAPTMRAFSPSTTERSGEIDWWRRSGLEPLVPLRRKLWELMSAASAAQPQPTPFIVARSNRGPGLAPRVPPRVGASRGTDGSNPSPSSEEFGGPCQDNRMARERGKNRLPDDGTLIPSSPVS